MNNNMIMNDFMNFLNMKQMMDNMNLNNNINNMNQDNNMNDIIYEEPDGNLLVKLEASSGKLVKLKVSYNTSIKKLIKIYCKNIGITKKHLGTDIIFLYNGSILDYNSKNKLKNLTNKSLISLAVIDKNGLLSNTIDIDFSISNGKQTIIKSSKFISVAELMKLYINIWNSKKT